VGWVGAGGGGGGGGGWGGGLPGVSEVSLLIVEARRRQQPGPSATPPGPAPANPHTPTPTRPGPHPTPTPPKHPTLIARRRRHPAHAAPTHNPLPPCTPTTKKQRGVVDTQLIAHDREVYDIAWGGLAIFATVSADGSVRVFDLRCGAGPLGRAARRAGPLAVRLCGRRPCSGALPEAAPAAPGLGAHWDVRSATSPPGTRSTPPSSLSPLAPDALQPSNPHPTPHPPPQGQGALHDYLRVAPPRHPPPAAVVEQAGPAVHGDVCR
jgi:hypothetical protein